MIKPLGPRIMRLRKNQPGMESLKRAAISRPPRGRGGASVSSRGEASLTSSGGDGRGIVDIVQQTINDYRASQQKTGRREICVDWNVNGDHQSPEKKLTLYIYVHQGLGIATETELEDSESCTGHAASRLLIYAQLSSLGQSFRDHGEELRPPTCQI